MYSGKIFLETNTIWFFSFINDKQKYIPLQSFNLDESLISTALASPLSAKQAAIATYPPTTAPIEINYKLCNSDTYSVLKIEEDHIDRHTAVRTAATQTGADSSHSNSKKGSNLSIWTSDESILKSSNYTVDEDNKSSSSSACEEAAGVLSSGKSGNSLDSTDVDHDNVESGIGTATPPKDQDHLWRHRKPLILSGFAKQSWSRTDNVQTQTSPSLTDRHATPFYFKTQSQQDDPDLLEVLSQCGDLAENYDSGDIDDEEEVTIDQMMAAKNKSMDCSFGTTDSSCSTKSLLDEEVVMRNNNNHINHNNNNSTNNLSDSSLPSIFRQRLPSSPVQYSSASSTTTNSKYLRSKPRDKHGETDPLVRREAFGSFDRRPFGLQIGNEPYANIGELPSPSSASLHSGGHEPMAMQDQLTTKSNSAPILLKKEKHRRDDFGSPTMVGYFLNYEIFFGVTCFVLSIYRTFDIRDHKATDIWLVSYVAFYLVTILFMFCFIIIFVFFYVMYMYSKSMQHKMCLEYDLKN